MRKNTESSAWVWENAFEEKIEMSQHFVTKNFLVLRKFFCFSDTRGLSVPQTAGAWLQSGAENGQPGDSVWASLQLSWGHGSPMPTVLGQVHFKCFLNKTISNDFPPLPQWNFPCSAAGNL